MLLLQIIAYLKYRRKIAVLVLAKICVGSISEFRGEKDYYTFLS